ncbi:MAG: 5-formyltetrahydrofolate cyclo-ligase [Leptospiraceae bacterium]|nr:5-formyltetrahydrofolate cyclo-ligase [Leptospiraceae bacterium]
MTKIEARNFAKQILKEHNSPQVSFEIAARLSKFFHSRKKIISYRAHPPEINLDFLAERYPEISFFYPKICSKTQKIMEFIKPIFWTKGNFGIWEPEGEEKITPEQAELCIIPCLGCNFRGYRLGRGGGFYDRVMRDVPKTRLLGITLPELTNLDFSEEVHDLQFGIVITPKNVIFHERKN